MAERSVAFFARCFGGEPRLVVAAPGRVNLIGEHTDYNEGYVLPMAIDRFTVMAIARNQKTQSTVHSNTTGESASFPLRTPIPKGDPGWSNYIRGVAAGFQQLGRRVAPFSAVIDSNVPFGAGLASSAALEVATATALEVLHGPVLDPVQKALLCQNAEHDYAGVPCGLMDQFTSVFAREGHALLLDCRSNQPTHIPFRDPEVAVLIINTNVRHRLADSEYARRRQQCYAAARTLNVRSLRDATLDSLQAAAPQMDPVVFRRARHVVTENARTLEAADAMQRCDWKALGELMYASHASLRDDYEVSCRELDVVVEAARNLGPTEGVIGCRMTGAGFGGSAVCLVKADAVKLLTRKLEETYSQKTTEHASIFRTRPAGGARILKQA